MNIHSGNRSLPDNVFWGEITPSEHMVEIYEDGNLFMDTLESYVFGGLKAGDGVIVIATPPNRAILDQRLASRAGQGLDMAEAISTDRYIVLDAEETLSCFMVGGWPDENRFNKVITAILQRAQGKEGRRVRAFGEMVAVLWAQGHNGATVRLEHLWHDLCQKHMFCLFCAYPRVGFTQNSQDSIDEICAAHSRVVSSSGENRTPPPDLPDG